MDCPILYLRIDANQHINWLIFFHIAYCLYLLSSDKLDTFQHIYKWILLNVISKFDMDMLFVID